MVGVRDRFVRRQRRVRWKLRQNGGGRARLSVFRSNKHIYAQIIDDAAGRTLAAASSVEKTLRDELSSTSDREAAKRVGLLLAERAKAAGVDDVVFDRGGRRFHGRVLALAEGAREGGLSF